VEIFASQGAPPVSTTPVAVFVFCKLMGVETDDKKCAQENEEEKKYPPNYFFTTCQEKTTFWDTLTLLS
jgi:hypothetical protein